MSNILMYGPLNPHIQCHCTIWCSLLDFLHGHLEDDFNAVCMQLLDHMLQLLGGCQG